jgi:AcrR family transcriptional regulator
MKRDSAKSTPPAELIWARLDRGQRGPQPSLTHEQIARSAIRLGDTEGLAAVSMRRVASELGVGTMSLYRYVRCRDDLLDLMLDAVYGENPLPEPPPGDWRAGLKALAYQQRALLQGHPWLTTVLSSRPPLGPNYLRHFECALSIVAPLGLDITTMMGVVGVVGGYVLGVVTYTGAEAEADRQSGLSDEQRHAAAAPYLERYLASGRFPHLTRFFHEQPDLDPERGFEFGLQRVLDGIGVYLQDRIPGCQGAPSA